MAKSFPIPVMPPPMPPAEHDYPITPGENLMRAFRHEKPLWMPALYESTQWIFPSVFNDMPLDFTKDGDDWFGTHYRYMEVQNGPTPVPGLFHEVGEWREKLIFPDLNAMDWGKDHFPLDPNLAQAGRLGNGNCERLHMAEGFEQALMDILLEQDECKALFDRLGEYKIDIYRHIRDAYPLNYVCHNDDWSNARAQFFSMEAFENTLLDSAVAIAEAVHADGLGYMVHCCGKMEVWLPHLVNDIHADVLEIQTINDIRWILETYGDKVSPCILPDPHVMYDPDLTPEAARAHARQFVDRYGAQTCAGAGCCCYLIGNKPETFYAFEDELFNYSRKLYAGL